MIFRTVGAIFGAAIPITPEIALATLQELLAQKAEIERQIVETQRTERAEAIAFLRSQASAYGLAEDDWPRDERPWADFCHVLVNLKEFIFVD